MKCVVSKEKMSAPKRMINSKVWCLLKTFYLKYYYYIGNTKQKTKNSIKSKNYSKSKTPRKLIKLSLIDWRIVIMPNEPCSGRKRASAKMFVDSLQN